MCIANYIPVKILVTSKDMQTHPPLPQEWPYLHERCAQCWNEWKIIFQILSTFFFSYGWLYLQFTVVTQQVCHRPNKMFKRDKIYRRDVHFSYNDILVFVQLLVFLRYGRIYIWSILIYANCYDMWSQWWINQRVWEER